MKPVLVIEDEMDILDLVEYHLVQAGFTVLKAPDGESGLELAKARKPALIILDIMLPKMDGKEVCRALKSNPLTEWIPVLMLTAKAEEVDRIVGFELGADDYVTKPFSPRELVLRVKAILRKGDSDGPPQKGIQRGDLWIDIDRHRVSINKRDVTLTSTEFKLLVEMASHPGRVFTREILLDKVWGYTYEGYARTVDTHIRRLREKMEDSEQYIETIRGVGYRFREATEEEENSPAAEG
jgi:two-component system phosphate regulon response regulator PhoB